MVESRTCKECGFLTMKGHELSRPVREELAAGERPAVLPAHPWLITCFKNLWKFEFVHISDKNMDDGDFGDYRGLDKRIFDENIEQIKRSRDGCPGFMPYEAGFTPAQHLEIQFEQRKAEVRRDLPAQLAETQKFPEAHEEEKEVPEPFIHSPDFRSVNKNGEIFTLTSKQAQIIEILYEAQKRGTPGLGQDYIIEKVSPDTNTKRLRDIFKGNLKTFYALIERDNRKGTFRLKK